MTQAFFDERYVEVWERAGVFARTAGEVHAILDLLAPHGRLDILDAPCGFGRHAGPLSAAGHRVVGQDASAVQLAMAEARNPGPTYVRGDMAAPPDGPFDVVLNLFASFGYAAEESGDAAVLAAWRRVLRPGGHLLLEVPHHDRVALTDRLGPRALGDAVEHRSFDAATGVVTSDFTMPDGTSRTLRTRVYRAERLRAMVADAGFVDVRVSSGITGGAVTPETGLVVHARVPERLVPGAPSAE